MKPPTIPNVLTIAGTDPSGGAGIQADLKAFSALGAFGTTVITALVAQNTRGVAAVHEIPADFVTRQIDVLLDDVRIDAVKIGMVANAGIAAAVADRLAARVAAPIVVDPVMVAKSGDPLLNEDAVAVLRGRLVPLATVITPNLPEAGVLLGRPAPTTVDAMADAGRDLLGLGPRAVLVKGGHLDGTDSPDLLVTARPHRDLAGPAHRHGQHPWHRLHAVGGHRRPAAPDPGPRSGDQGGQGLPDRRPGGGRHPVGRRRARPGPPLPRTLAEKGTRGMSFTQDLWTRVDRLRTRNPRPAVQPGVDGGHADHGPLPPLHDPGLAVSRRLRPGAGRRRGARAGRGRAGGARRIGQGRRRRRTRAPCPLLRGVRRRSCGGRGDGTRRRPAAPTPTSCSPPR